MREIIRLEQVGDTEKREQTKACCVTGHRDVLSSKTGFVEQELRREIQSAIDDGYRHFVSGFADGVDLLFSAIVLEYKETYEDITLEAALPYPGWVRKGAAYNALLSKCSCVGIHSSKYHANCFLVRNYFMVNVCDRVIAVYDGRMKGGTVNTLRYACAMKRDIHVIRV